MLYEFVNTLQSLTGWNLYPDNLPQQATTFPAVVYSYEDRPDHVLEGSYPTSTATITIELIDDDAANVDLMARTLRGMLDGYRGGMGTSGLPTYTVTELMAMTLDQLAELQETPGIFTIWWLDRETQHAEYFQDAGDRWMYLRRQEYTVRYNYLD